MPVRISVAVPQRMQTVSYVSGRSWTMYRRGSPVLMVGGSVFSRWRGRKVRHSRQVGTAVVNRDRNDAAGLAYVDTERTPHIGIFGHSPSVRYGLNDFGTWQRIFNVGEHPALRSDRRQELRLKRSDGFQIRGPGAGAALAAD